MSFDTNSISAFCPSCAKNFSITSVWPLNLCPAKFIASFETGAVTINLGLILQAVSRSLKEKYGIMAYILYAIKRFRPKINYYDVKYKIDGKEYTGTYSYIFVSNSSRIAGQPDVYYDVKLDDNMFEVAMVNAKNLKQLSKFLLLASSIDVKKIPGITYYRTNNFEIEFLTPQETSWCIDGEEYNKRKMKYVFRVEQNMKMLVPRENINELFDE